MEDNLRRALEERYAALCMSYRRLIKDHPDGCELTMQVDVHIEALEKLADLEGYTFHKMTQQPETFCGVAEVIGGSPVHKRLIEHAKLQNR